MRQVILLKNKKIGKKHHYKVLSLYSQELKLSIYFFYDWANSQEKGTRHPTICDSSKHVPLHDRTNKMTCLPSEDSHQPGYSPSLIRVFVCAQWVAKDPSFFHAYSEDSDQTGQMPRLIWVFAGRTGHFVGFVVHWLTMELDLLFFVWGFLMSLVTRKPVFGVCDQGRLKPACTATETN